MKPVAQISHQSSGRTRLKILEKKRDNDYFSLLQKQLAELQGIELVKINPLSSSILILHPESAHEDILADIEKLKLFDLKKAGSTADYDHSNLSTFFENILRLEDNYLDQTRNRHTLLFILLVGLAIREFLKGNIAPPAIPLLIYAMDIAIHAKGNQPNANP